MRLTEFFKQGSVSLDTYDGGQIVINTVAKAHLMAHPTVITYLGEAIRKVALPRYGLLETDVDLGRVIGKCDCVPTPIISSDTPTTFAIRKNRQKPSRVITGVTGYDSRFVTIVARPTRTQRVYVLLTAYIGTMAPPEPFDPHLSDIGLRDSLAFWTSHALIHDPENMGPIFTSTWREVVAAPQ